MKTQGRTLALSAACVAGTCAARWWVGDWLNYGERSYGEIYAQAVEAIGFENKTLRNAKWVASAYELSLRRDNLTFGHHSIVAALPVEERANILARAAREGWTCAPIAAWIGALALAESGIPIPWR